MFNVLQHLNIYAFKLKNTGYQTIESPSVLFVF